MIDNKLVAIVGPTGSGKSELAVKLAHLFPGEIVNADSRQLYRFLSIGTAKPTDAEMESIPHHLLDLIEPDQDFNLAEYQHVAHEMIRGIQSRDLLPFMVGGTGLYVWATIEGWNVPQVAPDWKLRHSLEERARRDGAEALQKYLSEIAPDAACKIDYRNVRRVIRALEVALYLRNDNNRDNPTTQSPPYQTLIIGLTTDRESLYQRIDARVDKMLEKGLVGEVQTILGAGFTSGAAAFKSVGYREVLEYLGDRVSASDMATKIKTQTHRLVRQQYNWFKLNDCRIHWFDIKADYFSDAVVLIKRFLDKKGRNSGFY
ncbi:MAG: tRNA (adenosine(37)-N6)-dimethylallyltransferase MiaA [Dehalogenimonas sp.]|uniref:tRNA dimethylallyltransferase n=1 Tax=Candidatus Dehalogenimonas loeffleri TaxID=3127115 RepID=A0ABZ2J6E3_9CHLR|nr:tRNA (adenosine(37)-N6)-dimethylallyltransferase MiaA [Dehalogenimonas sp.]